MDRMNEIRIDGDITRDTAVMMRSYLSAHAGEAVTVLVSSFGGDVASAVQISHAMSAHGDVTLVHDSWNASAATWLFGARVIKIYEDCMLYVHCSSVEYILWRQMNAEQLRELGAEIDGEVDTLEKADLIVAKKYSDRSGGKYSVDAMLQLMQSHPWLTASECLEYGLVDEVIGEKTPTRVSRQMVRGMKNALIPVPEEVEQMAGQGIVRQITDGVVRALRQLFGGSVEPAEGLSVLHIQGEEENQSNDRSMKECQSLQSLLGVAGFAVQDGNVVLREDELGVIEDALSAAAAERSRLSGELEAARTELQSVREKLRGVPDGAATPPSAGGVADEYADIRKDAVNFMEF